MNKGCIVGIVVVLISLTAGLAYYFYNQANRSPQHYESVRPEMRDVLRKAVATGSIKPRKEINVKPQVSGVVDELYVNEGELVVKGQELAKIKLIPSEVNINSARSNVELAKIRVEDSKNELARVKEINARRLNIDQAKINYETAKSDAERNKRLFDDGIISKSEYDQFILNLELKKSVYENTKISSTNDLRQAKVDLDIRQQELDAAINNLQLLKEGATRNSKQVSNIILSTVDGMVLDVPVEEGSSVIERNNFNEGTSVAVIADMNNLIFEGMVDESDVGKLREGMNLVVTVGAILSRSFDATLEFISPKGVEEEGSVKFEIEAALHEVPEDVFLRAGYSANADVILERKEGVIAVQERDVIYENEMAFVEVEKGDQLYERMQISIGISDGLYVEVRAGLDTTTLIKKITDPQSDKAE